MELLLWSCIFLIVYPYAVYPLVMRLIGLVRPRRVKRSARIPTVSILIPAYNEADCIAATVQNKLDQYYPADRMQIIVISDGSTDGTDEIVTSFADPRVTLLRREGREGKAAALNDAVGRALGEIVIFSDANTLFGRDAVARIVENFADPEVGYLTGALRFTAEEGNVSGAGVDAYMRYENVLREVETRAGSIIGVNGGVDAIRKSLYVDIPPHLITDFVLPLSVIAAGRRVVFDPRVTAVEDPNTEIGSEFRMRVRVALRAMQGLSYMRRLFNPFRYPLAAFCLVSHKVLRYGGFVFMLGALFANMALALHSDAYLWLLVGQLGCYAVALAGLAGQLPGWLKKVGLVPSYLLMSNAAFAFAVVRYVRGDTMAVWKPRAG